MRHTWIPESEKTKEKKEGREDTEVKENDRKIMGMWLRVRS